MLLNNQVTGIYFFTYFYCLLKIKNLKNEIILT